MQPARPRGTVRTVLQNTAKKSPGKSSLKMCLHPLAQQMARPPAFITLNKGRFKSSYVSLQLGLGLEVHKLALRAPNPG